MLGKRWIYDGTGDPVWQAQLRALLAGEVQAQHQNNSHTFEPLVAVARGRRGGARRGHRIFLARRCPGPAAAGAGEGAAGGFPEVIGGGRAY